MQFLVSALLAREGELPHRKQQEKGMKNEEFSCQQTATAFRMCAPVPVCN
jgi:hypothetical protein